MDGADPRAGQHRIGGFRNHRKIDGDAVALLDVAGARDVGHPADLVMQLPIGDVPRLGGIVALPDDGGLVAALVEVAVDAVPGDVEDAVLEPFDRYLAGCERGVLDLGEGLHPADPLGLFGPEGVGIADRAGIHLAVLGFVDKGALGPFRGHVVNLLGHLSDPPPMRPANAGCRPLFVANDYASGLTAPTSGTNTTFDGLLHARDQIAGPGPSDGRLDRHHDRVFGRSKSRTQPRPALLTVTRNRSSDGMGLALPAITP